MSAGLINVGREYFARDSVDLAPLLLGAVLAHTTEAGRVAIRISEVYAYFTYGMHTCLNVVAGHSGTSSAVLLRGGTVVDGVELARSRRPGASDRDLARWPARFSFPATTSTRKSGRCQAARSRAW